MMDPSLEWMIDKDNPPDNLPDVTMTAPTDPRKVRFVSTPAITQPAPTTQPEENDDMILLKTEMTDDLSLMGWTPDNDDPPNNKDNSPKVRKPSISISRTKIQQFVGNNGVPGVVSF